MIVADASALIAFLDGSDAHHDAAVRQFIDAEPPILVHRVTAAEVLVGPTRRGDAAQAWADLVAIGVELDDILIDPWALAARRIDSGCKLPDCCVLVLADARQCRVVTVDDRLARAARRRRR